MELNTAAIGKTYDPDFWEVNEEEVKRFAAGYNDLDNPSFKDAMVAPPMYVSRYTIASMFKTLFDSELNADMGRLLHGDHAVDFFSLAKPGETVKTVARVEGMEEKSSGEILLVRYDSFAGERKLTSALASFFVRARTRAEKKAGEKPAPAAPPAPPPIAFTQKMTVTGDQTYRYAWGSGDHNRIHVDEEFALSVGLPGVILQGLCTMAFGSKALMDCVCNRDPYRLKRYSVRFNKPVRPHDVLTTDGWVIGEKDGRKVYGLEVKNQDGVPVLVNGRAEIEA